MGSSSKSYEVVRSRNGKTVQLVEKTKLKSGKVTRRVVSANAIRSKARPRSAPVRSTPTSYKMHSPFGSASTVTKIVAPSTTSPARRTSSKKHMKWPKWQPTLTPILSASFSELPLVPQTMMPGLTSRPVSPRAQPRPTRSPPRSPRQSPKPKKSSFFTRATARLKKKGVVSALTTPF